MCSEQSIGCTPLEQWYTSGAVQFWAFLCTHTHTHTGAVQFRGNPREDGQAWSEKKGKEDKLEAMQKGEEKWGRFFHSAAL